MDVPDQRTTEGLDKAIELGVKNGNLEDPFYRDKDGQAIAFDGPVPIPSIDRPAALMPSYMRIGLVHLEHHGSPLGRCRHKL